MFCAELCKASAGLLMVIIFNEKKQLTLNITDYKMSIQLKRPENKQPELFKTLVRYYPGVESHLAKTK